MPNCIHGIDARWCAKCNPSSVHIRSNAQLKDSAQRKRAALKSWVDASFYGTPPILVITGKHSDGWRLRGKGFSSSGQKTIEGMHDQRLRFMLSFIPRRRSDQIWDPLEFTKATATAPVLNDVRTSVDGVDVEIAGESCKVLVPVFNALGQFNSDLGWKITGKGNPAIQRKPYLHRSVFLPLREIDDSQTDVPSKHGGFRVLDEDGAERIGPSVWEPIFHLELQLLLVLQPPARKPDPVYFDWERRFFPGGLPSIGKRA